MVLFLARSAGSSPKIIGLLLGLTTLLSFWALSPPCGGPPVDSGGCVRQLASIHLHRDGRGRRGTAPNPSEPAGLAGSCLVAICYMLPRSLQVRGWRRAGALVVAASAAYLGAISTSATFVVAGVTIAVVAGLASVLGFVLRRTSVSAIASVTWPRPRRRCRVDAADHRRSRRDHSERQGRLDLVFTERSSVNSLSLGAFLDTFGFGVGLGANRASSFLPGLLSSTGIIGTLLFVTAVVTLIRRSAPVREYRPVVWALVGLLVVQVIAGPDLSDPTGVLWISLGLLSHAALSAGENDPSGAPAESAPSSTSDRLRLSL